ncbi:MAG: replication factor C large subunit [Candidatus Nanoarchaeia archaeon]|nr:replication factor C large subunit [Candidatus Nanoarchaeia archaeon]
MMSFLEKYAPKKLSEIIGQSAAVMQVVEFLNSFKTQKNRALIIHGPTGTGKTATVYAIANEMNYEIIELNASDFRGKNIIEQQIGSAMKTGSLFGKKRMIFIDEAESFTASDRGGMAALIKLIKESRIPVVLIALDIWDQKLKSLKSCAAAVEFKKIHSATLNKYLQAILTAEGIEFEPVVTEFISKNASGDVRAALTDLETISSGKRKITAEDTTSLEERPKAEKIFSAVQTVFKTEDLNESRSIIEKVDIDPEVAALWITDNIANEYELPSEIAKAYNYASRADVFSGRILRRQSWELYKYVNDLVTAGVSASKQHSYHKFTRYMPPSKLLRLYQTKAMREMKKSICAKFGAHLHASSKKIQQHYLPFMKNILKSKPANESITKNLALEKEELAFISK